jgi:hypothetical protein
MKHCEGVSGQRRDSIVRKVSTYRDGGGQYSRVKSVRVLWQCFIQHEEGLRGPAQEGTALCRYVRGFTAPDVAHILCVVMQIDIAGLCMPGSG